MTSRGLNSDPLRNFRFRVAINHPSSQLSNLARMGFMACSGLSVNNEVIPYREGGNNTTTRKMPGQSDFGPQEIYTWFTQIFSVAIGAGFGSATTNFRVGLTIDVLEHPITNGGMAAGRDQPPPIKARFAVYNAWPMGYSFSDLEAGGNAVFIENLTLAHEGWAVITANQDPGSFVGPTQMP